MQAEPSIAVLIPCHNEADTVGNVVDDFRVALPAAKIYVFDNCSTDGTAEVAAAHGASVIPEPRKGKGFVVESMLDRIDSDVYVMVDGDGTYPAEAVHELLGPVMSGEADMAVGARLQQPGEGAFRPLHRFGNHLIRHLINLIFGVKLTDILSGYRAFTRKVAERIPVVSAGFEVETELTIHMLYYHLTIVERQVAYRARSPGSESKLRTFRDGFTVVWKLFNLIRAFKPLTFFGSVGIVLFLLGVLAGIPTACGLVESGYEEVRRLPLAILASGLILLSAGSVFLGLILHAINWRFKELHNVLVRRKL